MHRLGVAVGKKIHGTALGAFTYFTVRAAFRKEGKL
jgi:hypothetical protein